ncbi:MAG: hypothetical protein PVG39_04760 [Desulfobacteraceae bacterium]|jgi:hypothetical protein
MDKRRTNNIAWLIVMAILLVVFMLSLARMARAIDTEVAVMATDQHINQAIKAVNADESASVLVIAYMKGINQYDRETIDAAVLSASAVENKIGCDRASVMYINEGSKFQRKHPELKEAGVYLLLK